MTPIPGQPEAAVGPLARGYALVVVGLRLVIIAGWAAAVAAAIVFLPPLNPATDGLSELIPPGSPAAHAESDASRLFGFPLDAAVAVVQRDPRGLPTATQVRAVISLPPDLDPVLVVLLLGVTTDYSVFFLDGMRARALRGRLAALGRSAGLSGVRFEVAGQTALIADSINAVFADLGRVALAIVVVTLILLVLFLRSLLAPVYLLAASILAVFATLGLAMLICRAVLGSASMVYFVPFAAGVLLVSLGSDYNVFVVGRIWEEARRRTVPDAVAIAAPGASRAITTAGVALAASFAMLAVIPLEQFRQLAITMAVGVILDAIAVRSLLVRALVALFGRLGM